MIEFVAPPAHGRTFSVQRPVHLGDAGVDGRLRVDAAARLLQDVASDDWDGAVADSGDAWVVRRTALELAAGALWPSLGEVMTLTTWCGGYGAAWAERRTTIAVGSTTRVEAVALWVPVGADGRPHRLPPEFFAVYGESAGERRVSARVPAPRLDDAAPRRPWPIRRSDLDVVGHVNNAAIWCALTEVVTGPVQRASLTHHRSVEAGGDVWLHHAGGRMWLVGAGEVLVSGDFELADDPR